MLLIGHYLQGEARPDSVVRLVWEQNYVISHCLHSKAWPSLLSQRGMVRMRILVLALGRKPRHGQIELNVLRLCARSLLAQFWQGEIELTHFLLKQNSVGKITVRHTSWNSHLESFLKVVLFLELYCSSPSLPSYSFPEGRFNLVLYWIKYCCFQR